MGPVGVHPAVARITGGIHLEVQPTGQGRAGRFIEGNRKGRGDQGRQVKPRGDRGDRIHRGGIGKWDGEGGIGLATPGQEGSVSTGPLQGGR